MAGIYPCQRLPPQGRRTTSPLRGGRIGVRVGRAQVGETLEEVGVRPEPVWRDFALGEHGQPVRDNVVREQAAVGVPAGLGGVEAQHVGQDLLGIDHSSGLFPGVAPHVL